MVDGRIKQETALHAFLAALIAVGVAWLIKEIWPVPRPFMINHLAVQTITTPLNGSFPSQHAAAAFALAASVWLHNRKIGWGFIAGAVLVGWARIWANVHYPIDIVAGAILGSLVAVAVDRLHVFAALKKKRS